MSQQPTKVHTFRRQGTYLIVTNDSATLICAECGLPRVAALGFACVCHQPLPGHESDAYKVLTDLQSVLPTCKSVEDVQSLVRMWIMAAKKKDNAQNPGGVLSHALSGQVL